MISNKIGPNHQLIKGASQFQNMLQPPQVQFQHELQFRGQNFENQFRGYIINNQFDYQQINLLREKLVEKDQIISSLRDRCLYLESHLNTDFRKSEERSILLKDHYGIIKEKDIKVIEQQKEILELRKTILDLQQQNSFQPQTIPILRPVVEQEQQQIQTPFQDNSQEIFKLKKKVQKYKELKSLIKEKDSKIESINKYIEEQKIEIGKIIQTLKLVEARNKALKEQNLQMMDFIKIKIPLIYDDIPNLKPQPQQRIVVDLAM